MKLNIKLATWKRKKDLSDPSIEVSEGMEVRGKEGTELVLSQGWMRQERTVLEATGPQVEMFGRWLEMGKGPPDRRKTNADWSKIKKTLNFG